MNRLLAVGVIPFIAALACFAGAATHAEPAPGTETSASERAKALIKTRLWARATPPGGTSGAIYGELTNTGTSTWYLRHIGFEAASHVMVHKTVHEDGMMKMKHASVSIAPGETVTFEPGGLHIMLMDLKAPLKNGCGYEVTLHWGNGGQSQAAVNTGHFGQSKYPDTAAQSCQ